MFFDTNFFIVCLYFLALSFAAPSTSPFRSIFWRIMDYAGAKSNQWGAQAQRMAAETHTNTLTHSHPNEIDKKKRRRSFMFSRNWNWNFFTSDSGWRGVAAVGLVCGGYKFRNIKNFNLKPFTAYILIELQFYFNKMKWRNDVFLFHAVQTGDLN